MEKQGAGMKNKEKGKVEGRGDGEMGGRWREECR